MTTLYILNNPDRFQQCSAVLNENDGLLLIENAVVLAQQLEPKTAGFVLEEDLVARGLDSNGSWGKKDYDGFVALTLEYDKTVSWL